MGKLKLAERVVSARSLWPDYRGTDFTPHCRFALKELERDDTGAAIAVAWPDEADPLDAEYAPGTRDHWRYAGQVARQYWRAERPDPALEVLVNGRVVYWNSRCAIPGGVSFENFEMVAPFRDGQEFWFGIDLRESRSRGSATHGRR